MNSAILKILVCGHGYLDMTAYADYMAGKFEDYEYPEEKIKEALKKIPII